MLGCFDPGHGRPLLFLYTHCREMDLPPSLYTYNIIVIDSLHKLLWVKDSTK